MDEAESAPLLDPASPPSREDVRINMTRSSAGLRELQHYLNEIKDLDDEAFAEATCGADRAEAMELLERLNSLLAGVDDTIEQLGCQPSSQ